MRRQARNLLDTPADGHTARRSDGRMVLLGALVLIVAMTMGLYIVLSGLYMAGEMTFGAVVWLSPACDALYLLLLLVLVLPLVGATFRIAACMTAVRLGMPDALPGTDNGNALPTVVDIFYPFTSLSAYGRTMLVVGEATGWLFLIFALPLLLFRVAELPLFLLADQAPTAYGILSVARPLICLLIGAGMLFLSGCRAGFGYYLFTCPSMSVRDTARYVRGLHRPILTVLCLRLSFAGWIAFSIVGLGVPFLLHVGPLGLMTSAVYARTLSPS